LVLRLSRQHINSTYYYYLLLHGVSVKPKYSPMVLFDNNWLPLCQPVCCITVAHRCGPLVGWRKKQELSATIRTVYEEDGVLHVVWVMFCACYTVCLSVKRRQPLAASHTQHRGPVVTTFIINLITNYPVNQKLYTFTCTVTVCQVQIFLLPSKSQHKYTFFTWTYDRLESKAYPLLMYYKHSISKALTDTKLNFCAGNPQHGSFCCQAVHSGFALQIWCRKQVFIPNNTTLKMLQPFQLAIDNYFSEISMVGYYSSHNSA
jgi:hypothetical protein